MSKKRKTERKTRSVKDPRRALPSVAVLLELDAVQTLIRRFSRPVVTEAIREVLETHRKNEKPDVAMPDTAMLVRGIEARILLEEKERLRPVVNATGIILHTGLGRAVLPPRAVEALAGLDRCCNLQIDLETGLRGKRNYMTERLLCRLTGAEAAMLVTNNAAATLLILTAFCKGKEAVVSRGQLIEIGGSFRLPDCVHQSGAILREVGTTNKTHLRDYEAALSSETGVLLRVNPSNYRIIGFEQSVPIGDLVALRNKDPYRVLYPDPIVVDDLGCGALVDLSQYGLPKEPTVRESIVAGADLVCFSGDKLIGGPQAGIIVGRKDLVQTLKKHPLSRMLRVGKLTDLALEQTLRLFLEPETLLENHPTLRMLATPAAVLRKKALRLKRQLRKSAPGFEVEVVESESATGGGSLPGVPIPSFALAVRSAALPPDRILSLLRANEPPVIARIVEDRVLLDMRTLLEGEERVVLQALTNLPREGIDKR